MSHSISKYCVIVLEGILLISECYVFSRVSKDKRHEQNTRDTSRQETRTKDKRHINTCELMSEKTRDTNKTQETRLDNRHEQKTRETRDTNKTQEAHQHMILFSHVACLLFHVSLLLCHVLSLFSFLDK